MKFSTKMTLCILMIVSLLFGISSSLLISISFYQSLQREKDMAYESFTHVIESIMTVNMNYADGLEYVIKSTSQLYEQNTHIWSSLQLSKEDEVLYQAKSYLHPYKTDMKIGECHIYIKEISQKNYLVLNGGFEFHGEIMNLEALLDITSLYSIRNQQQNTFIGIFVIMIILCTILSYTLSKTLTSPLERLSKTSLNFANGDFSSRVSITSDDEIGKVSRDFNTMAECLEDTIEKLQDTLNRQEEFMGSFAHELKTPMTSIIGYSDLIRSGTLNEEEQLEASQYIFLEGRRLEGLSLKLLDLLVLDSDDISFEYTNISDLIISVVSMNEKIYASHHIHLTCECEDVYLWVEPDLIKSLMINLIDNARKAIDRGGNIHVELKKCDEGCMMMIRDDGRGIPEESLSRITDAFYRVDKSRSRRQGGAGLGLALCHKIVTLHNGHLYFDSELNKGTCVTVKMRGEYHED